MSRWRLAIVTLLILLVMLFNNDALASLRARINELRMQMNSKISQGAPFQEVKGLYLKIKEFVSEEKSIEGRGQESQSGSDQSATSSTGL